MLVLFESAAGFALFKISSDAKLTDASAIHDLFTDVETVSKLVKLSSFQKFKDMEQALKASKRLAEGKVSKKLKKLLKNCSELQTANLAVSDPKIGTALQEKLNISCVTSPAIQELFRGIREHINWLIPDVNPNHLRTMSVGLAHSYSRYKLKFNPDRIDTMIIQGINLLDDIDKEVNNYVMRCREWYSWHFPELAKLITDNLKYVKIVKEIGFKNYASTVDLTAHVDAALQTEIRAAATVSMGTDITETDLKKITALCDQIIQMSQYRVTLTEYIANRMQLVAPNLTILVGDLVGARLISHAGSLMNLAKQPSSTVQLLGAEKALFNSLKAHKNTPKYGLIYHASLVSQASINLKGKISRTLAAKCALAIRCDALSEQEVVTQHTIKVKAKLEQKLAAMEQGLNHKAAGRFNTNFKRCPPVGELRSYNPAIDVFLETEKRKQPADSDKLSASTDDLNLSTSSTKKKKVFDSSH